MTRNGRPDGRRWQAMRERVFGRYGRVCHHCGHGGADQVDHLVEVSANPGLAWQIGNLRPIHGRRCPTCGVGCNQARHKAMRGRARPAPGPAPGPAISLEVWDGETLAPRRCDNPQCSYGGDGGLHPVGPGRCW